MMTPPTASDTQLEAAAIAVAMLRFMEPLAHPMSSSTPEGQPVVGRDAYVFLPSPRQVPRAQLPAYLAALPCPAFLAPTTARGFVFLSLLDELSPDRRSAMEHDLRNQTVGLAESVTGSDSDRVLLEFDDEVHLFSLAALRLWVQRFGIFLGWNIWRCQDPIRAEWRMNLYGGDGRRYSRGVGPPGRSS